MSDLEANNAVVLRLIEVFNGRRLDLLEEVLHPEFRGRGISALPTEGPEIGPVLGESSTRCSIKRFPTREARCFAQTIHSRVNSRMDQKIGARVAPNRTGRSAGNQTQLERRLRRKLLRS
jgi:hypothetical protein